MKEWNMLYVWFGCMLVRVLDHQHSHIKLDEFCDWDNLHIVFLIFLSSIITMLRQSKQQRGCSSPPWCTKLGLDVLWIKVTASHDFFNAMPRNKYTRSSYETNAVLSTPPTAQKFAVVFVHSRFKLSFSHPKLLPFKAMACVTSPAKVCGCQTRVCAFSFSDCHTNTEGWKKQNSELTVNTFHDLTQAITAVRVIQTLAIACPLALKPLVPGRAQLHRQPAVAGSDM